MPTPSGQWMNSSGWQFTVNGGATYTIPRVKDWSLPRGISRVRESADYDHFYTVNVCDFEDPMITLSTLNPFSLDAVGPDVFGTLTGFIRDSSNGVLSGGGGRQLTLINSAISDQSGSGSHRQIARNNVSFCGTSVDGVTSPLTIAVL